MAGKAKKITYANKIIVMECYISFWVIDNPDKKKKGKYPPKRNKELKREKNPFSYWNSFFFFPVT